MNDEYRSEEESGQLTPPLDAALQALMSETLPEDAIERVKARARQLAVTPAAPAPQPQRRVAGRRTSARSYLGMALAAAAVVTVMFGFSSWFLPGQAFAQVLKKVDAATSVSFSMSTQFGKQPAMISHMFLQQRRLRIEHFDGKLVCIGDFEKKRALYLDGIRKLAQTTVIDSKRAEQFTNPIDQLRHLTDKDVVSIGEEDLNGRRVKVFRLQKAELLGFKGDAQFMVWADATTGLPVKIVSRDTDPKSLAEFRYENFQWNQVLDDKLFSIDVPGGYEQGTVVLSPQPRETSPKPLSAEPNAKFAQGILSDDRVPGHIVWNQQGTALTALMRDPEGLPANEWQPHQLRQWDATTGKLRWSEYVAGAGSLASTADGKTLATVIGYEVQLRDGSTGKVSRTWTTERQLSPLAFSPNGRILAAGIAEWARGGKELPGGIEIWNVEQGTLVRTITDDKPVTFVKFSNDGKLVVSSSNSGPIKLVNASSGELVRIFPGSGRADFSHDDKLIACPAGKHDADKTVGVVNLYNSQTGELVRSLLTDKAATNSYLLSVNFSPDGKDIVASDWNGTVTVWKLGASDPKGIHLSFEKGVHAALFSPDGSRLATGSEDKTLRLTTLIGSK